jgi:hypothetical protein
MSPAQGIRDHGGFLAGAGGDQDPDRPGRRAGLREQIPVAAAGRA